MSPDIMKSVQVLLLKGKAKDVFADWDKVMRAIPNTTLKELRKEK